MQQKLKLIINCLFTIGDYIFDTEQFKLTQNGLKYASSIK